MYVNDFLLASNIIVTLKALKVSFAKEYNIKDFGEIKIIIGWQIYPDFIVGTMKIDQSSFVRDLVIKKRLNDCNANVIPMKAGSSIKNLKDYKEANFYIYQRLIEKLMYLIYGTRPDIAFAIGQFSKYNPDPRKKHL